MPRTVVAAAAAVVVAVVAVGACGRAPDPGAEVEASGAGATGAPPSEVVERPLPTTTTTAPASSTASPGDRDNPLPVGREAVFANGWTVKVLGATPSAWAAVKSANQFNDPPPPGHQFYMVAVSATYTGPTWDSALGRLHFGAVDSGNTTIDEGCGVIPGDLDVVKDVFSGGSLTGNVCFPVRSATAGSLVMYVDAMFVAQRVFFAVR